MLNIGEEQRKYKCVIVHVDNKEQTNFKTFLKKNIKTIDEDNSDVFLKHTNFEAWMEGKKSNKFDFVIIAWNF